MYVEYTDPFVFILIFTWLIFLYYLLVLETCENRIYNHNNV